MTKLTRMDMFMMQCEYHFIYVLFLKFICINLLKNLCSPLNLVF